KTRLGWPRAENRLHRTPAERRSDTTPYLGYPQKPHRPGISRHRRTTPMHGLGARGGSAGGPQLRKSGGPELRKSGGTHPRKSGPPDRSEEHTSELQSLAYLVCRLLLEKKNKNITKLSTEHTHTSCHMM